MQSQRGWTPTQAAVGRGPGRAHRGSGLRSVGKALMILIAGLICAINLYFVVIYIPTLGSVAYYVPLAFVLAGYVAFTAYLVGRLGALCLPLGSRGQGLCSGAGGPRPGLGGSTWAGGDCELLGGSGPGSSLPSPAPRVPPQ